MNYSHLFEVNETTGSVFLSSSLDYDTLENLYLFSVQATDRNGMEPALSRYIVITVLSTYGNGHEEVMTMVWSWIVSNTITYLDHGLPYCGYCRDNGIHGDGNSDTLAGAVGNVKSK